MINLNEIIVSILCKGEKSPHLKSFVELCASMALTCYYQSRFNNKTDIFSGCSINDIAFDLIADLFSCEGGKFVQIEKYFSAVDFINAEEEILKSKLSALVFNRTRQRITRIRIESGEIFFNVEKNVNEEIKRHPEFYYQKIHEGKVYVFTCDSEKVNLTKNNYTKEILLDELFCGKYKTYSTPEVMKFLFEFLNDQNEYCKAIEKVYLISVVTDFYKKRKDERI